MKKLSFLMALIICLTCVLLAACNEDKGSVSLTETNAVVTTAPAEETTSDTKADDKKPEAQTTDTDAPITRGEINEGNDAFADDIY